MAAPPTLAAARPCRRWRGASDADGARPSSLPPLPTLAPLTAFPLPGLSTLPAADEVGFGPPSSSLPLLSSARRHPFSFCGFPPRGAVVDASSSGSLHARRRGGGLAGRRWRWPCSRCVAAHVELIIVAIGDGGSPPPTIDGAVALVMDTACVPCRTGLESLPPRAGRPGVPLLAMAAPSSVSPMLRLPPSLPPHPCRGAAGIRRRRPLVIGHARVVAPAAPLAAVTPIRCSPLPHGLQAAAPLVGAALPPSPVDAVARSGR